MGHGPLWRRRFTSFRNHHYAHQTIRFRPQMADKAKGKDSARGDEWVRITSTDGFSYLVRRKVASTSGTLRNMLNTEEGGFTEAVSGVCNINERGIIVEKLVEYMAFKSHYENPATKEDAPVKEFMERIPPEIVLELLLAADYQEM